jgi:hypothetical protein
MPRVYIYSEVYGLQGIWSGIRQSKIIKWGALD